LHGGGYGSRFDDNTTSGPGGQYQFKVPPLEVYILAANTADRRQASVVHAQVPVYPLKPVSGVDLTIVPTTRVFGRVTVGPENKPGGDYWIDISSTDLCVKMDPRWLHVNDVMQSLRGEGDGNFLWYAIVDAQGKILATSDLPGTRKRRSSIGYPIDPKEIDHFIEMFKSTAQRMTANDLAQLKKAVEQKNR
jgi:hypothetical protein